MRILKFFTLLIAILTLLACSFSVNVPSVRTGLTQTLEVSEPPDAAAELSQVNIEMGAGSLQLSGGTDELVEGTIVYNVEAWKPEITRQGNTVTLSQKTSSNISFPEGNYKNNWDLKIGSMPLELSLTTGAYEGELDLGGLSITRLSIADGASKSTVRFDQPNASEMSMLSYKTGASEVDLLGLGNARVSQIEFNGGVGSYTLDFTGENDKNVDVSINSGMSDITITIPANARAAITIDGELSDIDLTGTWTVENNVYHAGTEGALININISMAVGDLQLIYK